MARIGRGIPIRSRIPALPRYQINDYAAVIDLDNPISHWRLGESSGSVAVDRKGVQNGTYNGGITKGVASLLPGTVDLAAQFDGVAGSRIDVAPHASHNLSTAISVEVWTKRTSGVGNGSLLSRTSSWDISADGSNIDWSVRDVNDVVTRVNAHVGSLVFIGRVKHVIVTYAASGTMAVYVDGVPYGSPDRTPNANLKSVPGSSIYMGAESAAASTFPQTSDEVSIYGVALTPTQAQQHYQAGMGYPATFVGSPPTANIVSTTRTKISRVAGFDSTDVVWSSDGAFTEYQFRVVPNASDPVTQGVQLEADQNPSSGGTAGTQYTSTITDDEVDAVSPAEGAKVVKLFVKNASGWSS